MKYIPLLSLATAFVAFTVSSHANRLSEEIFSVKSSGTVYPVMAANAFNNSDYDVNDANPDDVGSGNAWNSGLTDNFVPSLNFVDYGDQKERGSSKTTYVGPKVYIGITRDYFSAQLGIHHENGNAYRIRMNNVLSDHIAANDGNDILARGLFMFDVGAQTGVAASGNPGDAEYVPATPNYDAAITLAAGDSWEFRRNDNIFAKIALPAAMGPAGSGVQNRASLANYRPIVKANGEYYAGTLHTVDLNAFATDGNGNNTRIFDITVDASSTIWTKMENVESTITRYHTSTNADGQINGATNLIVDTSAPELAVADTTSIPGITKTFTAGATTVAGTALTNIQQVGFLLETSGQEHNGGYNYGVREFRANATRASAVQTAISIIPWSEDFDPAVTLNTAPTGLDWGAWHVDGAGITDSGAENSSITNDSTLNYPILQTEKFVSASGGAVALNAIGYGTVEPRFTKPDDYEATYVFDLIDYRDGQADLIVRTRGSDGYVQLLIGPGGVMKFTHSWAQYRHTTFDEFNGPSKFRKPNSPTSVNNGIVITSGGTFDPASSVPVIVTISRPVDSSGTPIGDDPLTTGLVQNQDAGGDYIITADDIINGIVTIPQVGVVGDDDYAPAVVYAVPGDATVGDTLEAVETDGVTATATVNMNIDIPQVDADGNPDNSVPPLIPANSYVESVTIEEVGYNYVDEPTVTFSGGGMIVAPEFTFNFETGDRMVLAPGKTGHNTTNSTSTSNVINKTLPNNGSVFDDENGTLTVVQSYDSATDTITYYYGTGSDPVNNVAFVANPADHSAGGYGFYDVISGNPDATVPNDKAITITYQQWGAHLENSAQEGTPASDDYQPQVDADGNPDYSVPPLTGTAASENYQAAVTDNYATVGFKSYALEFGTSIDADGDGYLDRVDAFTTDPAEWLDTDGDTVGDNSDEHNGLNDIDINNSLGLTSGEGKINLGVWLTDNNYAVDDGGPSLVDHNVVVGDLATANASLATANASLATANASLTAAEAERDTALADLTAKQTELDNAKEARPGSIAIDVTDAVIDGVTTQVANITLTVEETDAVSDWSNPTTSDHTIQLDAPASASFYRFTIDDE